MSPARNTLAGARGLIAPAAPAAAARGSAQGCDSPGARRNPLPRKCSSPGPAPSAFSPPGGGGGGGEEMFANSDWDDTGPHAAAPGRQISAWSAHLPRAQHLHDHLIRVGPDVLPSTATDHRATPAACEPGCAAGPMDCSIACPAAMPAPRPTPAPAAPEGFEAAIVIASAACSLPYESRCDPSAPRRERWSMAACTSSGSEMFSTMKLAPARGRSCRTPARAPAAMSAASSS